MTTRAGRFFTALPMLWALSGANGALMAAGQETAPASRPAQEAETTIPASRAPIPVPPDPDARQTAEELRELMQQYPPSLGAVLRLDPTLLDSPEYLAPYPTLAAFIAQHPEIAKNPSYFFGSPDSWRSNDPRTEAVRAWVETLQGMMFFSVFLVVTGVLVWLIRTLVDYRRWVRITKVQTEAHGKLLDRFTSSDELLAYVQTPAGRRFLESAPVVADAEPRAMGAPLGRILWSLQAGCVLALGGVGLQFASRGQIEEIGRPLMVMGILGLALGAGFIISAVMAYLLSKRLGLFSPPAAGEPSRP